MKAKRNELVFRFMAPFLFLAYYSSVLIALLLWPLAFLYRRLLCAVSWYSFPNGKAILAVHDNSEHSLEWILRIRPLLAEGSTYLNWENRKNWDRWSLPVQLFWQFGPQPIPQFFMPHSLPAVLVFRKFRTPKRFTFGDRAREPETKLEELRLLIAGDASKQP